jgi:hypothetical protein
MNSSKIQKTRAKLNNLRQTRWGRWLEIWHRFDTPEGVLGWQAGVNSTMLPIILVYGQQPWLVLGLLCGLMGATYWLHGRRNVAALSVYAALGFISEIWMVMLGPVWVHSAPIGQGFGLSDWVSGGVGGVPYFMLPVWGMIGALMLALAGYFNKVRT